MANTKTLAILPVTVATALRTSVSPVVNYLPSIASGNPCENCRSGA